MSALPSIMDEQTLDNPSSADGPRLADRILLVEDDADDIVLFRRALAQAGLSTPLDIVTDGELAIKWLTERVADADNGAAILPRAVVLDLRLPGVFGSEVLRWIRTQRALQHTVVAICSASDEERDIAEAERLGAQAYLRKFPTPARLAEVLRSNTK